MRALIRSAIWPPLLRLTDGIVRRWYFDARTRERFGRQEFFANAFKALRFNDISGDYAEFGAGWGVTFGLAYKESRRLLSDVHMWAFDSFQGLPGHGDERDEHPQWIPGKMATPRDGFDAAVAKQGIPRAAYTVVEGYYDDTLAVAPDTQPTDIALAYVDCDLYSSTKTVLEFLAPRLKHGMIVAFDDYFCWSPTQVAGERRAQQEFAAANDRWEWLPWMQYGWSGMSFVIEDRRLGGATVEAPPT